MKRFRERRACWHCQADFVATLRDMVFCSQNCGVLWRANQAPAERLAPKPIVDRQGYVTIGGQYEHRLVVESILGRRLRPTEDVHHLNGIRHDNRPENLSVLSHRDHATHHHAERRGDQMATRVVSAGIFSPPHHEPIVVQPITAQRVS